MQNPSRAMELQTQSRPMAFRIGCASRDEAPSRRIGFPALVAIALALGLVPACTSSQGDGERNRENVGGSAQETEINAGSNTPSSGDAGRATGSGGHSASGFSGGAGTDGKGEIGGAVEKGGAVETGGAAGTGDGGHTASAGAGGAKPPSTGSDASTSDGSTGGLPAGPHLVINEFMPANKTTITDESGGAADWIELYNPTASAVELAGYYISDDPTNPAKTQLSSGLTVPANGVLLLWADGDVDDGVKHLPFKLSRSGESVLISDPRGTLLDSIDYVEAADDESYARIPNGTGNFVWCSKSTPGELNGSSCGP